MPFHFSNSLQLNNINLLIQWAIADYIAASNPSDNSKLKWEKK